MEIASSDSDSCTGRLVIAIDGPAAVGKNTLGLLVARHESAQFVDTGVMFRVVAWLAIAESVDIADEPGLRAAAERCAGFTTMKVSADTERPRLGVFYGDIDVTEALKIHSVEDFTSRLSVFASVRAVILSWERLLASKGSTVMVGRDVGTVVLPDADVKLFLTASPEVRALRRYREYQQLGQSVAYEVVLARMLQRDHRDSTRAHAPLKPADDAVLLDTNDLTVEEVFAAALRIIDKHRSRGTGFGGI